MNNPATTFKVSIGIVLLGATAMVPAIAFGSPSHHATHHAHTALTKHAGHAKHALKAKHAGHGNAKVSGITVTPVTGTGTVTVQPSEKGTDSGSPEVQVEAPQPSYVRGTVTVAPTSATDMVTITPNEGDSSPVVINLTASTVFSEEGVAAPDYTALVVGAQVEISVDANGNALEVRIEAPQPSYVRGTVTVAPTSATDMVTITPNEGDSSPVVINLTASTVFSEEGVAAPDYTALVVGAQVEISVDANGNALEVRITAPESSASNGGDGNYGDGSSAGGGSDGGSGNYSD